ncbi:MAG: hypothetical protein R3F11_02795 [Verrucomicrobiales bacterium]
MAAAPAGAALLAYDGFDSYDSSGGYADPSAGPSNALIWDADTTVGNGFTGQAAAPQGFTGTWQMTDAIASFVYPRVDPTTLGYTDSHGFELQTRDGQATVFRSSGTASRKIFYEDLNIGTSDTYGGPLYASFVVDISDGQPINIRSGSWNVGDSASTRRFGLSTDASGNLSLFGFQATNTDATAPAGTLSDGSHLIVWKMENNVVPGAPNTSEGDLLTMWVDPTDLRAEAYNTAAGSLGTTRTNFFVADNPAWSLRYMVFESNVANGGIFAFDEVRVGTTWQSVLPIPEPDRALFLALGIGALALRRRR